MMMGEPRRARRAKTAAWIGGASLIALAGAAAMAQTVPPEAAARQQASVEEIVVTATKRSESLGKVPFSINAQTEEQIRQSGATNVEELSRNVAGLTIQNLGPGQSQVAIRGVSAGQIVRDLPGVKEQVGVYLDESVISLSLFTPDLDLYDLSRVEVLRGPQGTLFGSGSDAGTIRYITNQPVLNQVQGGFELTGDSVTHGDFGGNLKGYINTPVGDNAALRAVAYSSTIPGFIDAVQPNGTVKNAVNEEARSGVRVSMLIQPNNRLSITPRIIYQYIEADGFNREDVFNILANPYTTTRPPVHLGELQQFTQLGERFKDTFRMADLDVNYNFDWATLTSISTYTNRDVLVLRDSTQLTGSITGQPGVFSPTGLPENVYTLNAPLFDKTHVEVFSQEVRLASNNQSNFNWLVGAFYSDVKRMYGQTLDVAGFTAATGIPSAGAVAPTDNLFFSRIPYDLTQYAGFGEATYSITPELDLTAGLRGFYYDETRHLTFDGLFATPTIDVPQGVSSSGVTPRVILAYKATPDIIVNLQASEGFRLGGINDPLNVPLCGTDLATFQPLWKPSFQDETVWNYEAGVKSKLLGGKATFNAAVFYADISDLQTTVDAGNCSSRIILNVPSARSVGVEGEFTVRPTDSLDFGLSGSYADSELTSSVVNASGVPIQGLRDGNRLPTVPRFQFTASGTYTQPIATGWDGFATATVQYVGDRITQIADQENNPQQVTLIPIGNPSVSSLAFDLNLPAYALANFRIGARNDNWEAAFYIDNLTDEVAKLAVDRERGLRARFGYLVNTPRTFGVTLRYDF